jgi:hypothetical protein
MPHGIHLQTSEAKSDYANVEIDAFAVLAGSHLFCFLSVCVVPLQAFYWVTTGDFLFRRVDYELSFAGLLQQLLQERGFVPEKKIEIINAGIPAMPVRSQLAWFERAGKGYMPDLVIQFVYGSMAIPNITEPQAGVDEKSKKLQQFSMDGCCGQSSNRPTRKHSSAREADWFWERDAR